MKIFITSDTHFNHSNIIKYCNRPFTDIKKMNEEIIKRWNSVVSNDDIVYHLGDFGFGSFEELKDIFDKLNGKKYLIMGNHDYKLGKNFYKEIGFLEVYRKECILDNFILTHHPKEVYDNKINLYGHIHDKPLNPVFDNKKHFCVCLDRTDFYPIELDSVK